VPSDAAGGQCSYCLLQIGLSSAGGSQNSRVARTTLGGGGGSAAERFVRQGVLPTFGDYELEAEIARGGMGVVYRARQRSLNRVVAIKMILAGQLATAESVQRFRLEAQAAARLQHPGIVPIYEIGECETHHYFSMELIEGPSLAQCLDDFRLKPEVGSLERRQQEKCIAELVGRVARALDFAHQRGVLHRDLKPSNILIDERGNPRLTDFGLAKLTGREAGGLTLAAAVLGTPGYLAPEQAAGSEAEVTTAADVYGLGATLYELLTGRPPFVGSTALATMMMAIDQPPTPPRQINPAVHRDLETIALRCLEKAPQRRYHSAAAVADELERFTRGDPIEARPVGRAEQVLRWCRRYPTLAAVSCVLVGAIVGGSGAVFWQWRRAERANVALGHANVAMERANVSLTQTVADLKWGAIDDLLQQGQSSRALATVASIIRANPDDSNAAMFAMSVLEQRRFPVPAAPTIRHPGGAELAVARLSPDGQRIVTASFDGTARIWDAATSLELVPPLKHDGQVNWAEFSPDGRSLATCSDDKTARLWDVLTGKARWAPVAMGEAVTKVQFSPDGRNLLIRTKLSVCVLDASSGHVVIGPLAHDGPVVAARFLAGGACFFTAQQAGAKSCIRMWDVATGQERASLQTSPLKFADVCDDMSRVAVVGSDGHDWVADFPSGQRGAEIPTGNGDIMGIVFSPRGDRLALTGVNHWARVFDAQTGKPLTSELPHYYLLTGASFFQNGHELLTHWPRHGTSTPIGLTASRCGTRTVWRTPRLPPNPAARYFSPRSRIPGPVRPTLEQGRRGFGRFWTARTPMIGHSVWTARSTAAN
jgi:tRNA A-37 threonylcarbamoyl transferase component Bud32